MREKWITHQKHLRVYGEYEILGLFFLHDAISEYAQSILSYMEGTCKDMENAVYGENTPIDRNVSL